MSNNNRPQPVAIGINTTRSGGLIELAKRARASFVTVVIGTTLMSGLFLAGYFLVQSYPLRIPYVMPLTGLDALIPFEPNFLIVYLSLWIYLGTGPGLQPNSREIARYALWIAALGLIALLIFWIFPTKVPLPPTVAESSKLYALYRVDLTSNACPSMHVAAAMFTVLRVHALLRQMRAANYIKAINVAWFLGIAYSTVAIRQHVVLDVLAGALFGVAFAVASLLPGSVSRWRMVPR